MFQASNFIISRCHFQRLSETIITNRKHLNNPDHRFNTSLTPGSLDAGMFGSLSGPPDLQLKGWYPLTGTGVSISQWLLLNRIFAVSPGCSTPHMETKLLYQQNLSSREKETELS